MPEENPVEQGHVRDKRMYTAQKRLDSSLRRSGLDSNNGVYRKYLVGGAATNSD